MNLVPFLTACLEIAQVDHDAPDLDPRDHLVFHLVQGPHGGPKGSKGAMLSRKKVLQGFVCHPAEVNMSVGAPLPGSW